MANLDLRPLSLGEMLDRIFSLYRQHFWLFMGINAVPQVLVLLLHLAQTAIGGSQIVPTPRAAVAPGALSGGLGAVALITLIIGGIVYVVAGLFAQGGTVYAVSDLYLGRATTARASLERMRGHALQLFGVSLLNGFAVVAGLILLFIPGLYVACRLITCIPAAMIEDLGSSESLSRSWDLTRDFAGRSFAIYLLYFVLLIVASMAFAFPFGFMAGLVQRHDPATALLWKELGQVGDFLATILVVPFLTIATAVFYFDLRIRKEALDLQLMMNPDAVASVPAAGSVPSMFS